MTIAIYRIALLLYTNFEYNQISEYCMFTFVQAMITVVEDWKRGYCMFCFSVNIMLEPVNCVHRPCG